MNEITIDWNLTENETIKISAAIGVTLMAFQGCSEIMEFATSVSLTLQILSYFV